MCIFIKVDPPCSPHPVQQGGRGVNVHPPYDSSSLDLHVSPPPPQNWDPESPKGTHPKDQVMVSYSFAMVPLWCPIVLLWFPMALLRFLLWFPYGLHCVTLVCSGFPLVLLQLSYSLPIVLLSGVL